MKKILLVCALVVGTIGVGSAFGCSSDEPAKRKSSKGSEARSFIVLGDIHYCEDTYYDLEAMLAEKPGDHRQITQTYIPITESNWADQVAAIKKSVDETLPPVACIVQLGDMSEGLANREGLADRMAKEVMEVLRGTRMGVPWILTKGNHDITGVGICKEEARSAFGKYYTPFIKEQIGSDRVVEGNYTYQTGDILFVVLDAYNREVDQVAFARQALENTTAKYKFVCMHDPAIPATERCWHYMKSKPAAERAEFLKVLAQNKAFFLCGHLHRYSVLKRETEWGPIVQVMATSVTNTRRSMKPSYQLATDQYGPYLVDWKESYSPSTADQRKATLEEEAKYVSYYKMNNLAGYAVISVDPKKDRVVLRYFPMFGEEPFDEIDLTELYNRK